jgi:hypothetical protein
MFYQTKKCAGLTLAVALALFLGPHSMSTAQDKKGDIKGKLTKYTPANEAQKAQGILAVVLIEGDKTANLSQYDKGYVKITKNTKIWKIQGMQKQPATVTELEVGMEVTALFVGPVAESYPVQGTAGQVIFTAEKDKK